MIWTESRTMQLTSHRLHHDGSWSRAETHRTPGNGKQVAMQVQNETKSRFNSHTQRKKKSIMMLRFETFFYQMSNILPGYEEKHTKKKQVAVAWTQLEVHLRRHPSNLTNHGHPSKSLEPLDCLFSVGDGFFAGGGHLAAVVEPVVIGVISPKIHG